MAFLNAGGPRKFPVEGCLGRAATRMVIRVHFFHRHFQDTVIILEEGNLPYPRCPRYQIMVPWRALNGVHLATAQCDKGAERKQRCLAEEKLWKS